MEGKDENNTWRWMWKSDFIRCTNALICSAQEQSLQTIKCDIDKYIQVHWHGYVHWKFCEKLGFNRTSLWYNNIDNIGKCNNLKLPLCRMCGTRNETISYIARECGKLAQKECKQRHDSIERYVHWQFYEKLDFNRTSLWYEHEPESVIEDENFKILWDFNIKCNHMIEARRRDIMVIVEVKKEAMIIKRGNTRRYNSMW